MEFEPEIPRWRQVYEVLCARIESGEYPPGSRVPSIVQVAAEFGIANATAQKVLRALKDEGLTYTEPGLGSSVRKR
ncbi:MULTISPECIES: GntR family transcriptional regulator [unclassified Streptomyces]|uniref:GntR family transcriptional regulator n=1 Tax=unclassified Streptomyces TaxID=2593676 RepID=UPI0019060533|nr:winged helix-turn-helix domain-containing protein [Streptomyces sp. HSG2]